MENHGIYGDRAAVIFHSSSPRFHSH